MRNTQYVLNGNTPVLSDGERTYILKIRDLPAEEKPRERLIASGPGSLSIQELLAVILGTGTKKEEILAMSSRILKEYGERSVMGQKNATTLSRDLDIPLGKAAQIVATAELGRRFFEKNGNGTPAIRTAREVFEYAQDIRTLSKEHLRGIYLNSHYRVIHDEVISIGTIDANLIHPREVFRPAIEYAASAVILVHNHPSGVVEPSAADLAITEQIVKAGTLLGIDLIDHVIVSKDSYKSVPAPYH